jgi:hypothetical protein
MTLAKGCESEYVSKCVAHSGLGIMWMD